MKTELVNVEQLFPTAYETSAAAPSPGKGLCYVTRVADAIRRVAETLPIQDGKVVISWPVARDVVNLLWAEFKKSAKECDGKEIVIKRPTGFLGILPAVAAWLGLRIWD